jgi:hypothetical protein
MVSCLILGRNGASPGDPILGPEKVQLEEYVVVPIERFFDEDVRRLVSEAIIK